MHFQLVPNDDVVSICQYTWCLYVSCSCCSDATSDSQWSLSSLISRSRPWVSKSFWKTKKIISGKLVTWSVDVRLMSGDVANSWKVAIHPNARSGAECQTSFQCYQYSKQQTTLAFLATHAEFLNVPLTFKDVTVHDVFLSLPYNAASNKVLFESLDTRLALSYNNGISQPLPSAVDQCNKSAWVVDTTCSASPPASSLASHTATIACYILQVTKAG